MGVTWNVQTNETTGVGPSSQAAPSYQPEGDYSQVIVHPTYDVRWTHWGLAKDMNLARTAADFYLLYDLSLEDQDEGRFQQLMDWILPQFVNYTDMAVGGELRHSKGKLASGSAVPKPLATALKSGELPMNRHAAWHRWKFFRAKYGTVALAWADRTFRMFKGGGYGGPKWGNIAKVLWMYERDELTPISFIDTCWGLEHNGGAYFNKAWGTNGMKAVLDANLHENFDYVRQWASPSVKDMHVLKIGS
jgi:hypothetical protein